ncbi:MAG: leucine--tRNA ligase [Candidatus Spechtbacteria bacterium]|nr:leucine--tRNA ligase [Candidatus Spechtbacteria bacterium]
MTEYNPLKIEQKWRDRWEKEKAWNVDLKKAKKPYYNLMMFPYPSAEGLHVGNVFTFTGVDIHGRYMRMRGYDVFEPMGFDAFGIHSENFAIKQGTHPQKETEKNISHFREQLKNMGAMFNWDHEVDTSKPEYYKWTQWLFLQLYKAGLAYRAKAPVDWCEGCKTVLADEQVISGKCERCGTDVIQKELEQWFFRITKYAERLLGNLDKLDWSEAVKVAQRNWIGRSVGTELEFRIKNLESRIKIFTTRPDTLFGATYLVLSPEHEHVPSFMFQVSNRKVVEKYIGASKNKTELERTDLAKEKTGVELKGVTAINPANNEEIPVWIADYVLSNYGTGAIMAVPAYDERDMEFAKKFKLPVSDAPLVDKEEIVSRVGGEKKVNYHLRDWLISRQRYWGPPIPIIYCNACGVVPVPEKDLPVLLPYVENFRPTGTDKSPLANVEEFAKTTCPKCGGEAQRETDVSDTFLDSSWYFLRYPSTEFDDKPFDEKITKKWLPVSMYIGGKEHSVLHLMYARFVTMALEDMGYFDFQEPFLKFRAHGLLIKDGAKMSKSKGNVVSPDEYFDAYGADVMRMFLMFLGPYEFGGDWRDEGIAGIARFLKRVWTLSLKLKIENEKRKAIDKNLKSHTNGLEKLTHKTIKKVTEDIEKLQYNTAIAGLMEYVNTLTRYTIYDIRYTEILLKLLAPFAPHLAEELWHEALGHTTSIHSEPWPTYDPEKIIEEKVQMVVQVNGKVRGEIEVDADASEDMVKNIALKDEKVRKWLDGEPKKVIVVPWRVVSIVT